MSTLRRLAIPLVTAALTLACTGGKNTHPPPARTPATGSPATTAGSPAPPGPTRTTPAATRPASGRPEAGTPATGTPARGAAGETVSAASRKEADELFATRCVPCHGAKGKGDGVASAALKPPPRDYSDTAWQAGVTDDYIEKAIVGGGPAVGKSPFMPPNPDLASRPEVVRALRAKIRAFAPKK